MGVRKYSVTPAVRYWNHVRNLEFTDALYFVLTVVPISLIVLVPFTFYVWGSVWSTEPGFEGHFTLAGYIQVLNHSAIPEVGFNTVVVAIGGMAFSITLAIMFMVYTLKTNGIATWIIPPVIISQYLLPGYISAIAWRFYAGPNGLLNEIAMLLPFVTQEPFDVFSLVGIVVVGGANYAGLVFLLTSGGMKAIPPILEEAASINGASISETVRTVILPLVLPGLAVSALLVFTRLSQSFGIPLILGVPEGIHVIATLMYSAVSSVRPNFAFAAALGMMLLALILAGLFVQRKLKAQKEKYETVTGGEELRSKKLDLGKWRYPISAFVLGCAFLLYVVPYLVLTVASLDTAFIGFSSFDLSFENYRRLFVGSWSGALYRSAVNTILIAVGAATIGMTLSTLASYIMVQTDSVLSGPLDYLTFTPAIIPGIIMGVAFMWMFLTWDPLDIYGTLWILILAFSGKYMVYGTRAVNTSFRSVGGELEDAGRVAGAGIFNIFKDIFAPLIRPGFSSGFAIYCINSTKSLTMPLLLVAGGNEMIQVFLLRALDTGTPGIVAATGVLLMAFIFAAYGFLEFFTDIDITSL